MTSDADGGHYLKDEEVQVFCYVSELGEHHSGPHLSH